MMLSFKTSPFCSQSPRLRALMLLLTLCALVVLPCGALAGEITGKVVAVFHEKVQRPVSVQNPAREWVDKLSVTVADCHAGNRLTTLQYPLAAVSEAEATGFHFRHLAMAARAIEQQNPFMSSVSGHVTLTFDEATRTVQKTEFWGYNWACGRNLDTGASAPPASAPPPSSAAPPGFNPMNMINPLKRLGF
ncbi:MAG: hypothetical protein IPK79_02485 [Vampirovibrionales bacterium]|nr:hypothetical protein [Vampirovibrionales bacterium]